MSWDMNSLLVSKNGDCLLAAKRNSFETVTQIIKTDSCC